MLSELEDLSKTLVYFAHPYTSCEKGSVERHNGLIRRFIPKGKRIDSYSDEQISQIETWCNSLPRKLLGTVLRMISSRMNWIGFIPVSPDRLFNCQCSTCYCNLRQFSILITASYIILIISGSIINIYE